MTEPTVLQQLSLPDLDDYEHDPRPDTVALDEARESAVRQARTTFGLIPYTQNIQQEVPPWLIQDFLQSRAIHVISAAKGCAKTWLGLNILLAGRYGIPLLGHASTHFNTVYIAADSPLWDIRRQLRKLIIGYGLAPDKYATSFLAPLGFRLDNPEDLKALALVVSTWNIRAIILDVLLYCHAKEENDDREMSEVMKLVKVLRDKLGLAVVLLHHHGKTRGDARGADTILQASEHHYELRKKSGLITLYREKVRGEEDWTSITFSLTPVGESGKVLAVVEPEPTTTPSPDSRPDTLQSSIESALSSGPQSRLVLRTFALSDKALDNALSRLRRQGIIFSPTRGNWALSRRPEA